MKACIASYFSEKHFCRKFIFLYLSPMFKINEDSFGSLTQLELSNMLTGEYATILHDYGTCVNELVLNVNGKNRSLMKGTKDPKEISGKQWFKSAKMAPFPNRIRDGKYSFNGQDYQLPLNDTKLGNAIHGFVFDKVFELLSHDESQTECSVELQYSYNGKMEGFPFPFKMNLTYILSDDGLECETLVVNTGQQPMPFGDGWHPYFQTNNKVDRLQLCLPSAELIELDDKKIPTGKLLPFTDFEDCLVTIGDRNFDTGLKLKLNGRDDIVNIELYDPDNDILIDVWQEVGTNKYNYLQLYIPPDRQSIAIEPMSCAADAFNNGMGLITLAPGERFQARYGITVK